MRVGRALDGPIVTVTAGVTSRTTLFLLSAKNNIARGIEGDSNRVCNSALGRGAVVAAVAGGSVAGDCNDVAGRRDDLPDHASSYWSAMNRSPIESTATPKRGLFSSAAVAGPLSPL